MSEELKHFGLPLKADDYGLLIWAKGKNGHDIHAIDIRGWGYLTGKGGGLGLDEAEAIAEQKCFQALVVKSVNALPALKEALTGIKWKSADRDNMEFTARITYSQMDAINSALALLEVK